MPGVQRAEPKVRYSVFPYHCFCVKERRFKTCEKIRGTISPEWGRCPGGHATEKEGRLQTLSPLNSRTAQGIIGNTYMAQNPLFTQLTVMDLVPFGNAGGESGFYALRLTPPGWEHWNPGQFVMLRPSDAPPERLWGRPFSICRVTPRDMVIFFQVCGRATAAMAKLSPGEQLDVWGPLGNGFAVEARVPTLLLAGGIGIAPFVAYVQNHPTPWDLSMEFGHRMPLECYPIDSITEYTLAEAHQEKNPGDLEAFIERMDERIQKHVPDGLVLACGPTPFLRTVQSLARKHKARAQLSLETRMACGIGACLGCVVKACLPPKGVEEAGAAPARVMSEASDAAIRAGGSNVQTCTCGPVFWADSVSLA